MKSFDFSSGSGFWFLQYSPTTYEMSYTYFNVYACTGANELRRSSMRCNEMWKVPLLFSGFLHHIPLAFQDSHFTASLFTTFRSRQHDEIDSSLVSI